MSIEAIETAARRRYHARNALAGAIDECQAAIDLVRAEYAPKIRSLVNQLAARHAELEALIAEHPECFDKPKTTVVHDTKVGYRKQKGRYDWDDDAKVKARIRRRFPELAELLIATEEKLLRNAMGQLTGQQLKAIGVELIQPDDAIVITDMIGDVAKTAELLLGQEDAQ